MYLSIINKQTEEKEMSVEMKKCEKCGSFYDRNKHADCPYCNGAVNEELDRTMPINPGATTPISAMGSDRTVPSMTASVAPSMSACNDNQRTMPVSRLETGIDPVVGWLICVSGPQMGRDFKVHADNNYIGRSERMDICIRGDETISRENHATITYDNRDRVFYFTPGEGRSIVRLNGKALLMTSEIKAYDKIELGVTELIFVPLCGAGFDWSDVQVEETEE